MDPFCKQLCQKDPAPGWSQEKDFSLKWRHRATLAGQPSFQSFLHLVEEPPPSVAKPNSVPHAAVERSYPSFRISPNLGSLMVRDCEPYPGLRAYSGCRISTRRQTFSRGCKQGRHAMFCLKPLLNMHLNTSIQVSKQCDYTSTD